MRNTKRFLLFICALAAALSLVCTGVSAASTAKVSISVSSSKVTVGDSVTVTIKYESSAEIGSYDFTLEYDASVLKYVSGSDSTAGNGKLRFANYNENSNLKSFSRKVTFTAVSSGSAKLTTQSNAIVGNADFALMNVTEGSRTIKVDPKPTASTNNKLKTLTVSAGTLDPAFSASDTSYSFSVDYQVKKLNVSAVAEDEKAKVSISDTGLSLGANKITITVTAESGAKRTYTLNVTRLESTLADVTVVSDGWIFSVAFDPDQLSPPEGFEAGTAQIDGKKVLSFSDAKGVFTLVWLKPLSQAEAPEDPDTSAAPTAPATPSDSSAPASTAARTATTDAPGKTEAKAPAEGWYLLCSDEKLIPFVRLSPQNAAYVPVPAPFSLPSEEWTAETALIGQNTVEVFVSDYCLENGLYITYLKSADGSEGFYFYDTATGSIYPYRTPQTVTVTLTLTQAPASTLAPSAIQPVTSVSEQSGAGYGGLLIIIGAAGCIAALILLVTLIVSARNHSEEKKRLEKLVESYSANAVKKRRASRDPAAHFAPSEENSAGTGDDGADDGE